MVETHSEILGWAAFICLVLVVLKFVSKRISSKQLDRFLMKRHKLFAQLLIILGSIHGLLSFSSWGIDLVAIYLLGLIGLAAIVQANNTLKHHKGKNWVVYHRVWSCIAIITILLHGFLHGQMQ